MPSFAYKGINAQGKNTTGVIDGESEKAARLKIRKLGIFPTDVYLEGSKSSSGGLKTDIDFSKYFQRVTVKDIAGMTRQLSTLISAHIPIVDAFSALVEQTQNAKLKTVLVSIKEDIIQGGRLSDAVAKHPKIFSNIYISMIAAGEAAGAMEVVLQRLAELTEKQSSLTSKVRGALMYPMVMGTLAIVLVIFLMSYVVPKLTAIFTDMNAALPLPTQILIAMSDAISDYWYVFFIVVGIAAFAFHKYSKTAKGRDKIDQWKLKLPIFGNMLRLVAVSRFTRTLATLTSSGVQLLKAMDIVKNVVDNTTLANTIEATRTSIKEGESIAEPLKRSGQFPPMVTHMISIGEKTGELEAMLVRVADIYDEQVDTVVGSLTSILAPIIVVFMGGVIGFIVLSILIPMLEISNMT